MRWLEPFLRLIIRLITKGRIRWGRVRPPSVYGLAFEEVNFVSRDGTPLSGWLIPHEEARGLVLLCHGIQSTRMSMLSKARSLHQWGYASLLFDFRGRGESGGAGCTLGLCEPDDVLGALDFLEARSDLAGLPVGGLGESLGAASVLGALLREPRLRAVAMEACFATLEEAVVRRCQWLAGPWHGRLFDWAWPRLQEEFGQLAEVSPLQAIPSIQCPVLIIHDSLDWGVPLAASQRLFAAAAEPKEMWVAPRSLHVRASWMAREGYESRLRQFFDRHLPSASADVAHQHIHRKEPTGHDQQHDQ